MAPRDREKVSFVFLRIERHSALDPPFGMTYKLTRPIAETLFLATDSDFLRQGVNFFDSSNPYQPPHGFVSGPALANEIFQNVNFIMSVALAYI